MADVEIVEERVERVVDCHSLLAKRAEGFSFTEGPVWRAEEQDLVFSDIPANRLYRLEPAREGVEVYRFPSNMANGNTLDHDGRLISCEHLTSRVVREESDEDLTVLASHFDGAELNSPNDVIVDSAGRVLFTDPLYGRIPTYGLARPASQPHRGVYRLDPLDGGLELLADDFAGPNGLCLAEDESVLFVNDSERSHIRRFEMAGGELRDAGVWARLRGRHADADGMKVDVEGNVYCCGPRGVHIFDASGDLLGVVRVPEPAANLTHGDADRRTVYLTAGTALYSFRVRVPGDY